MTRIAQVLLMLATLAVAGCSAHTDNSHSAPPPGWPQKLTEFTMVWSAEPGIDLTTGPAVAVRAYIESFRLAYLMNDNAYVYPGFTDAVGHNDGLWPTTDRLDRQRWIGSERDRIMSITHTGDQVTAVICNYTYGSAARIHAGEYEATGAPGETDSGIYPEQITMTAPNSDRQPLAPQLGPARAPQIDVFNGWRVTGHRDGYFLSTGASQADLDHCAAKEPDPDERRKFLVGDSGVRYHPRTEFPTLPTYPGWPIIGD